MLFTGFCWDFLHKILKYILMLCLALGKIRFRVIIIGAEIGNKETQKTGIWSN